MNPMHSRALERAPESRAFKVAAFKRVPVARVRRGDEALVARSQAYNLFERFERFKEIMLDFAGIEAIGQAFSDEVFRVFREAHPDVHFAWINTNPDIERMIGEAGATRA
jgi:STAS-like domain of unknown function (DUF4325)